MDELLDHRPRTRAVLVLGMHRSGTSVVTRAMSAFGVDLGTRTLAPAEDNPLGFWENPAIIALNESVLSELGTFWHGLSVIDWQNVTLSERQDFVHRAVRVLTEEFANSTLFGFKDPRLPRLLPIWQDACAKVGADDRYVIVVRNPLSVARSLQVRDGFEREKSILLWLIHVVASLEYTFDRPRCLIDYDRFLSAPTDYAAPLAGIIGCDLDEHTETAFEAYARTSVADELRHSVFDVAALSGDPATAKLAAELYGALSEAAADRCSLDGSDVTRVLGRAQEAIAALKPLFKIAETWDRRAQILRIERSSALAQSDARAIELHQRTSEMASLRGERDLLQEKLGAAQRESELLQAQLAHAAREREALDAANRALMQDRDAANVRAQRSDRMLADTLAESNRRQLAASSWRDQALAAIQRGVRRAPVRLLLEPLQDVLPSRDARSVWVRENDGVPQIGVHGLDVFAGTWIELAFSADWPSDAPPLQLRLFGEHDTLPSQAFALARSPALKYAALVLFVPIGTRFARIVSVGGARAFTFGEAVATPISRLAASRRMWRRLRETGRLRRMLADAWRMGGGFRVDRSLRNQLVLHYLKSFDGVRGA